MEVGSAIREFIQSELLFGDDARSITETTPLCDGIIDSIGLMELVAFLEEKFGIQIDDSEVTAENFRTVGDIGQLVERGLQGDEAQSN